MWGNSHRAALRRLLSPQRDGCSPMLALLPLTSPSLWWLLQAMAGVPHMNPQPPQAKWQTTMLSSKETEAPTLNPHSEISMLSSLSNLACPGPMSIAEYTLLEVSCLQEFYGSLRLAQPFENSNPRTSALVANAAANCIVKRCFCLTAHKHNLYGC